VFVQNLPNPPGYKYIEVTKATVAVNHIEVLNVNPQHKKAIILLLYRPDVKVLKDALAHLDPYQTLTSVRYIDLYGKNTVPLPATIQI
jgi:hypothetical protein